MDFGRWRVASRDRIFPTGTEVHVRRAGGRIFVASRSFTHILGAPQAAAGDDGHALQIASGSQVLLLLPLEGQVPETVVHEMNADPAVAVS
jgi:hypothetical protein